MPPDPSLAERLARHGQSHLLAWWDELAEADRIAFEAQLRKVDLDQIGRLYNDLVREASATGIEPDRVRPIEVHRLPRTDAERVARRHAAEAGGAVLASGEVAVVMVAGGSGTRLGFEGPKGTYPIGPVSAASLFQIHAEKIVATGRKYGRPLPLYVMTSPENHDATVDFFQQHDRFGLDHVRFFTQGEMPAVDRQTGKLLLAEKSSLALSPDGHGGTISALAAAGPGNQPSCLAEMRRKGIRTLFYFQVDNPLVDIADPAFLGLHRQARAEMSFKVIEKIAPEEKVGVVVTVDGKPQVIEYSDLSPALAERRDPEGNLELWAGSIAIHILELDFVERLVDRTQLPFHRADKKVAHVDAAGQIVQPAAPNAVKLERFIFDALPLAERWTLVETDRSLEFEPLKNATGPDSPASVRQRMSDLFGDWLERAGAHVPRRPDGSVPFGIEISPLVALSAGELKAKLEPGLKIDGPYYLK